jgi:hypothetical protein
MRIAHRSIALVANRLEEIAMRAPSL